MIQVARLSRSGHERSDKKKLDGQRQGKADYARQKNGCSDVQNGALDRLAGHVVVDTATQDVKAGGADNAGAVEEDLEGSRGSDEGDDEPEDENGADNGDDVGGEEGKWFLLAGTWLARWNAYLQSGVLACLLDLARAPTYFTLRFRRGRKLHSSCREYYGSMSFALPLMAYFSFPRASTFSCFFFEKESRVYSSKISHTPLLHLSTSR